MKNEEAIKYEAGKCSVIYGYEYFGSIGGLYVEILEDEQRVQLWEELVP